MSADVRCPECGQFWKKLYHTGVCIECEERRTARPRNTSGTAAPKPARSTTTSERDSIEPWPVRADIDG